MESSGGNGAGCPLGPNRHRQLPSDVASAKSFRAYRSATLNGLMQWVLWAGLDACLALAAPPVDQLHAPSGSPRLCRFVLKCAKNLGFLPSRLVLLALPRRRVFPFLEDCP
jgi:hypothetical protein